MGNPHPNLTNSFVSFFINSFRDLKDKTLLEIGSGESTVYWSNYFGQVCSYEDDPQWASAINEPDNVDLDLYNPSTIFDDDFFKHRVETSDFIIIDNNPKVLPRERIEQLLDDKESALEIGELAGYDLKNNETDLLKECDFLTQLCKFRLTFDHFHSLTL